MPPPIPDITDPFESMSASGVAVSFMTGANGSGTVGNDLLAESALPCVSTYSCGVTVVGGNFRGGNDSPSGVGASPAFFSFSDDFVLQGGTVTGGSGAVNGAAGVSAWHPTYFSMSSGTVRGGEGGLFGGTAVVAAVGAGSGLISGGSAIGGVPNGYALGATASGNGSFEVRGGTFTGGIAIGITGSGTVTFKGSGFSYSGGIASGVLLDGSILTSPVVPTLDPISYEFGSGHLKFYPTPTAPFWAMRAAPAQSFNAGLTKLVMDCVHRDKVDCGCQNPFRCQILGGVEVTFDDCLKCQKGGGDPR